jgi:acetylornithine deacetylase/succinyl-diaminopimelate desuccinylase-like protein
MEETIRDYLAEHRQEVVEELSGWVRLQSVAGVPEHEVDLRRSARWLAGALRDTGFPTVDVCDTEGGPAVFAEWWAQLS